MHRGSTVVSASTTARGYRCVRGRAVERLDEYALGAHLNRPEWIALKPLNSYLGLERSGLKEKALS